MASDNAAARALARVSSLGSEAFIARMNSKAAELGLTNTSYADPSGLLSANVSSAYDMAKLITYVSGDERIASVMRTPTYTVTAGRRVINIHSTNQLVMNGDVDVQAGKTGFITKSGYCLATLLRLPQGGPEVAVVVLGAKSNAGRFWETRHLFNWFASKAEDLLGAAPGCDSPRTELATAKTFAGTTQSSFFDLGSSNRAGSPPRPAAVSPPHPRSASPVEMRGARRRPSGIDGTRHTRTRDTARRTSQTT